MPIAAAYKIAAWNQESKIISFVKNKGFAIFVTDGKDEFL